jgi:hypothetical protein
MTLNVSPAAPRLSRILRPYAATSRFASALRLLTLIVVTSLVVGGIAAGLFIGLLDQLTTATR